MHTRSVTALIAAAASSFVVACGGEAQTPTQPAADKNQRAMLDFARCMRENGIDMPDPKFEGGRVTQRIGSPGQQLNPDDMRAAEKACAKYQDAIKPPELSDEEAAEFKQAALENARCMRENGVEKFPDPTFDEHGGAQIRMSEDMRMDPQDPAFQKAMKACEDTLPMGGSTSSDEGE